MEDDRQFSRVSRTPPPSPPRIPASKKGKGRASNAPVQSEETRIDDDSEDENGGNGVTFSAGPIPEAFKTRAYEAHKRFTEELEELARECNKPVKHFRAMVGLEVKPTRRMTAWDAYQKWYAVEGKHKPKDGMCC